MLILLLIRTFILICPRDMFFSNHTGDRIDRKVLSGEAASHRKAA